jgi:hypothetical protein
MAAQQAADQSSRRTTRSTDRTRRRDAVFVSRWTRQSSPARPPASPAWQPQGTREVDGGARCWTKFSGPIGSATFSSTPAGGEDSESGLVVDRDGCSLCRAAG